MSGKLKVLITFLILIILGLAGYIGYDKFYKKEVKEPEKEQKAELKEEKAEVKELDVNSAEVTNLYNNIDIFNNEWYADKYYCYLYHQDKLEASNIPDDIKVFFGIEKALKECGDNCITGKESAEPITTVSADKVKEQIKKTFGDIKYELVNTEEHQICGDNGYKLSGDRYTTTGYGCGMTGLERGLYTNTKLIKAEKKDNGLDIFVKVIYAVPNGSSDTNDCVDWDEVECIKDVSLYKDFNKTQLITTTKDNVFNDVSQVKLEVLNQYETQLNTYKLHFEKEDGEYRFKSVEKQ